MWYAMNAALREQVLQSIYIQLICGVNVGKYTIRGSYGNDQTLSCSSSGCGIACYGIRCQLDDEMTGRSVEYLWMKNGWCFFPRCRSE